GACLRRWRVLFYDVVKPLEERLRRRQSAPWLQVRRPPAVRDFVGAGQHQVRIAVLRELTHFRLRGDHVVVAEHLVQPLRREREKWRENRLELVNERRGELDNV